MSEFDNQDFNRSEVRRKKRMNTILNVAIGLVALLIVVISASMFMGGNDDSVAVNDDQDIEEIENNENEQNEENTIDADIDESSDENNQENVDNESSSDENVEANENGSNDQTENENDTSSNNDEGSNNESAAGNSNGEVTEGEWGPIGTVQDEPFTAVYDRDHVNWEEMTRALEYAMNTDEEDMIIEWLGNGGDHETAVGTVSLREDRSEVYEITLSWVENEGWMPTEKEQLSSNPYN
ncbi:YrrS family protein [Salisediminibacterium beveridgei]|uniref:DUF1510 domain-containing protein n=1 Tax=Salisediminibacterium beveridgei TaxID=632773 RepID=A0A1D7QU24_9BACI|nr:YrrS family protein [Salisediminibacterium beveridgei]AOM82513.1 hypothetical protein BBEV_1145 [Salisediminibacterium beveridgei]